MNLKQIITCLSIGMMSFSMADNAFAAAPVEEVVIAGQQLELTSEAVGELVKKMDESKVLKIPSTYTSIENYAFAEHSGFDSIEIPSSISSIKARALRGCDNIKFIVPNNAMMKFLKDRYKQTNVEISESLLSETDSWKWPEDGKIVVPSTVVRLNDGMFEQRWDITSVIMSDAVKSIGSNAFFNCRNLENVIMPKYIDSIGRTAFSGCEKLDNIQMPEHINLIEEAAFSQCASLTSVKLPNGIESITDGMFSGCRSLTNVDIPATVKFIDERAFSGCSKLSQITIPNSVAEIGANAFYGSGLCDEIRLPNSVKVIRDGAFESCPSISKFIIPDSVMSVGYRAFSTYKHGRYFTWVITPYDSVALTRSDVYEKQIIVDESLRTEENKWFWQPKDGKIIIPNHVNKIYNMMFTEREDVTSIDIPDSVDSIEDGAFFKCTNLKSVNVYSERVKQLVIASNSMIDENIIHVIKKEQTAPSELTMQEKYAAELEEIEHLKSLLRKEKGGEEFVDLVDVKSDLHLDNDEVYFKQLEAIKAQLLKRLEKKNQK